MLKSMRAITQLQSSTIIDRSSQLSYGLVYAGYGSPNSINFVNNTVSQDVNPQQNRVSPSGYCFKNSDGASRYINYIINPIVVPTNQITLASISYHDFLGEQSVICAHTGAGGARCQLQLSSSGYWQVYTSTGSAGSTDISNRGRTDRSNIVSVTIGMAEAGGTRMYVNGIRTHTATLSTSAATYNMVTVGARYNSGYGLFLRGYTPLQVMWGRALTEEEHFEFAKNPWQIFKTYTPPIFTPIGDSGVLIPDLSSPGVIDITNSSARPELNVQY